MVGIALKLLGIGRWLREAAGSVFSAAMRYPWQAALIVALVACGWQTWRLSVVKQSLTTARADAAAMIEAQKVATALAAKERAKTEKLSKDIADATDQHAADLDAISRRALADRMRAKAPRCDASGAAAAAVPDDPARDPGANSGGVYFTASEADNLRRHEVRSTSCAAWGEALIADGLAVPAE